jgi:mycothiol synthase
MPSQLHMLWPAHRLGNPPLVELDGAYRLRTYAPADADAFLALERGAGFTNWNEAFLARTLDTVLPNGLFLAVHAATGTLAATAMATHMPTPLHPYGGELGWVAGDPRHAGHGLGRAVCAAVVGRYLQAGYERIYLKTDDWRLPAIKIYLRLGFVPLLYEVDMEERWRAVCEKLAWPVAGAAWPRG